MKRVKPDPYRRERRRLRADAVLIARRIDRETRRRIWRAARRPFTSLSRALESSGVVSDTAGVGMPFLWFQVFPGWDKTPETIAWGRALCRKGRKAQRRREQRDRMAEHQAAWRGVCEAAARSAPRLVALRASLDETGEPCR